MKVLPVASAWIAIDDRITAVPQRPAGPQDAEMMIRKLRVNTRLREDDVSALRRLSVQVRQIEAGSLIVREGDHPQYCCFLLDGLACRSKIAETGKRQIVSFHIPGDMPDLQSLFLETMDHDLTAMSTAKLGFVSHHALLEVAKARWSVAQALWRDTLVDAAVFREWIVNLAARSAPARLAHLMAELRERFAAVGLVAGQQFALPITQVDLADALGLTPVHVNRVIRELRGDGVLDVRRKMVSLTDAAKVAKMGGFNDRYLHKGQRDT
ncbi:Crp/Fnr family transcriptional regulator [Bradyrhizobium sp. 195]|nr:Crp/Fnr family transcriptional regulator [Bradyrhizobium sp. 151]UPK27676.1 Crp/Fnr family transcriptional regulator [Bradyrhizobium sp. 195]